MKKIKIEKYLNSFMPFAERKERKNKNVKGYNLAQAEGIYYFDSHN